MGGSYATEAQPNDRRVPDWQGLLRMHIPPVGATIYIDGDFWGVVRDAGPIELGLSAGAHPIEVVKRGHRAFHPDVNIVGDRDLS